MLFPCLRAYSLFILLLVFILSLKRQYLVLSIILGRFSTFMLPTPHTYTYNFLFLCLPFRSLSPPFIAKPAGSEASLLLSCALNTKHILHCIFLPHGFSWHMASRGMDIREICCHHHTQDDCLERAPTPDPTTTHPLMSEKTPQTHGGLYSFVPLFTGATLNFGKYMSASCTHSIRDAVKESHLL